MGLGVPRVDLPCDGKTYLLVGKGFGESALRPSLADWPQMKYANTRNSCDTAYPLVRGAEAKWVAYLPAFDKAAEGCVSRMSPEHKNDFLTRMQEGNTDSVPCPCEMQVSTLPVIGVDEELTTVSGMWIYQYQTMLSALYPELLSERSGYFDKATERRDALPPVRLRAQPVGQGGRRDLGRAARPGLPPLQLVTPARKERS